MFPSKYPRVRKPRKHIKSKGKLFSNAELSWETACCNREPGSAPQSRDGAVVRQPTSSYPHACADSPHFWGQCVWWIPPWPALMGVAEKNKAPCFPYWRHDFQAPLQLPAVNVYTACSSSGMPLLLTHRAGGQHPLTEHLARAPQGRTTICQSQRWIIGLGLGETSRFLSPSFHPAWEYSRYPCSPDSGKTSQTRFQMERTVWRVRWPDVRSQQHLSFDHSKSPFPPQLNGKNSQVTYWGCQGPIKKIPRLFSTQALNK